MPSCGCSAVAAADAAVRPVLKSTTWIRPSSATVHAVDRAGDRDRPRLPRHWDVERQLGGGHGASGRGVPGEQRGDHLVDAAALVDALVVRRERHRRPDLVDERADLALVRGDVPAGERLGHGVDDQPDDRRPAGRVARTDAPVEEPAQRAVAQGSDGRGRQPQRARGSWRSPTADGSPAPAPASAALERHLGSAAQRRVLGPGPTTAHRGPAGQGLRAPPPGRVGRRDGSQRPRRPSPSPPAPPAAGSRHRAAARLEGPAIRRRAAPPAPRRPPEARRSGPPRTSATRTAPASPRPPGRARTGTARPAARRPPARPRPRRPTRSAPACRPRTSAAAPRPGGRRGSGRRSDRGGRAPRRAAGPSAAGRRATAPPGRRPRPRAPTPGPWRGGR